MKTPGTSKRLRNSSLDFDDGGRVSDFNLGSSLRYTFRSMYQSMQDLLEPHGIPIGMFYFLLSLWKGDGITQRELSDRVGTLGPGTVEQLRRMEKRGLVKRVPSLADRRKMHVFLTPKGRSLKNVILPLARKSNQTALLGFSPEEIRSLRNYLGRVRQNMSSGKRANGRSIRIDARLE